MSAQWMGYFFDDTDLKGSKLLLALAIADHADSEGKCDPGFSKLAKKIRLGERQTKALFKEIEAEGHVESVRGRGRGKRSWLQLKKVQPAALFVETEKVHSSTPFIEQKGEAVNTFCEEKRCNIADEKGAISPTEKVQSDRNPPTPPYKDNHLKQPLINRKKERAPVAADFGERQNTPRDLRFYHPALRAIRELTKSSPAKIIWDDLIDALGMEPDTGRLKKCLRVWVKNGFKEHNYGWAIDWYLYGIPEKYTLPNQQDRGYKRDITGRPAAEIDYGLDPGAPCGYCGDQYCLKTHIEDRRTAGDELAA